MQLSLSSLNFKKSKTIKPVNWDNFFKIYREPVVTYSIIPNNAPTKKLSSRMGRNNKDDYDDVFSDGQKSDLILNTISSLFTKFYIPERIRLSKKGIKIKLNDVVSYKILVQDGKMKFFLTIPKKWSQQFLGAIRRDWGQVDINVVNEDVIKFDPKKSKAMDVVLKHHHCLSIKYADGRNADPLYPSLSSLGSTMSKEEKLLIDFNIAPVGDDWKIEAKKNYNKFKSGFFVSRAEKTLNGLISKIFDFGDIIIVEMTQMIHDLMGVERDSKEKREMPFKPEYSDKKLHANSKGYRVQTRVIAEADEIKRAKHLLKNVQSSFEELDGDNQFECRYIKTKRGIKAIIGAVKEDKPQLSKGADIFFEKEMNQLIRLPNRSTLKQNNKLIEQDNFTRTEIHKDFFDPSNGSLPFAKTLDKDSKVLHFGGYGREGWTPKGRKALDKVKLDDRCEVTLISGKKGSGKTKMTVRQILQTFGIQYAQEEWADKSKSVVAFDVADGSIITEVYNLVPDRLKDRVIILNHNNHQNPIPVNFSDISHFQENVLHDDDFAIKLAEMEADLVSDIVDSGKSILVDRWFSTALQCAHLASPDYGIAEAIRILIDDDFRINTVMPQIKDERMIIELEYYNDLADGGKASQIINVIQNRLNILERDRKLWDCIAQKPVRDEEGNPAIDFQKWMDGDEDGAYLVLVYIPRSGVSDKFRKYLFAHYFLKIWQVALGRERGFAGREYRPETLIAVDEIHQIIDIGIVSDVFIEIFKEVRKYSLRYIFTLHGWSSLAKSSRGKDIKNAILDNGANLVMLQGGGDMFESFQEFMGDYTLDDFNNLMQMKWCGIFSIRWQGTHVFQAKMLPESEKEFKKWNDFDLYTLAEYKSPYSRDRDGVRADNLERIRNMLKMTLASESSDTQLYENTEWNEIN